MKKGFVWALLVLLGFLWALAGCVSGGEKQAGPPEQVPAVPVRVQAPVAPPSIPLVPFTEKAGVQVSWYQSVEEAMSRIMRDEVDISILPVNSMAILFNRGVPVQLGAVSTWGILYLVSADPQVNSWADLRGKTVAVGAQGFSPDLVFRSLLAAQGLQAGQDVQILYGASPEIAQLLAAGQLQVAVLPEPMLTAVLVKNPNLRIVLNLETEWQKAFPQTKGLPQAGLAVSKKFSETNPEAWRQFALEYAQNLAGYVNDPTKVGVREEQVLRLPLQVVRESLSRSNLQFVPADEAQEAVHAYLEQLYRLDVAAIGGQVPPKAGEFYLPGSSD
ncbi:MAG: ABC transporter substrate-binding protein [Heliobacteriaceae bacterium]|nr:ABC transporter substrate-binding protein [Heliobacteriaceae bacterium]